MCSFPLSHFPTFPLSLFSSPGGLCRMQVKQLQMDNIVNPDLPVDQPRIEEVLKEFAGRTLTSLDDVLPTYL